MVVIYCLSSELLPRHYLICFSLSGTERVISSFCFSGEKEERKKDHVRFLRQGDWIFKNIDQADVRFFIPKQAVSSLIPTAKETHSC